MEHYKYLILGAGPSGLACAHVLRQHGQNSFLVLEKENRSRRSVSQRRRWTASRWTSAAGHFLDLKRKEVLELLFQFMGRGRSGRNTAACQKSASVAWKSIIRWKAISGSCRLPTRWISLESIGQGRLSARRADAGLVRGLDHLEAGRVHSRASTCCPTIAKSGRWTPTHSARIGSTNCLTCRSGKRSRVAWNAGCSAALPAHGTFLYPKEHGYGEGVASHGREALGDPTPPRRTTQQASIRSVGS